jgi:hypothetical protein
VTILRLIILIGKKHILTKKHNDYKMTTKSIEKYRQILQNHLLHCTIEDKWYIKDNQDGWSEDTNKERLVS